MTARRAAVALFAAIALAAPAAASAATPPHLSPAAYATLVRVVAAADAGPVADDPASLRQYAYGLCGPVLELSPTVDRQTRWVDQDCRGTARILLATAAMSVCTDTSSGLACLGDPLHRLARSLRLMLRAERHLAASVRGDCRTFFAGGLDDLSRAVTATQRVADAIDSGRFKRVLPTLVPWGKAFGRLDISEAEKQRAQGLMRACDPAPAPPAPAPLPEPPPA
jgi:hypothetical protein